MNPVPDTAERGPACRECGRPVSSESLFCPGCGADLVAPAEQPEEALSCLACGVAVPPTSGYCPGCGAPRDLRPEEKLRTCRACGRRIRFAIRYCPSCGAYQNPQKDQKLRRRRTEGRWKLVKSCIIFYIVYLATIVPLFWLPDEMAATGMIVVSLVDVAVILVYWRMSGIALRPLLGLDEKVLRYSAIGVAGLALLLPLNIIYHRALLRWFDIDPTEFNLVEPFSLGGYGPWVVVLVVCVMPAIWEEVAFRGLIQGQLGKAVGRREALLMTAVLFTIIHLSALSAPYLLLLGITLGVLRQRSGSLIPGIALHFVHNLVVVIIEYHKLT